jgi:hypothetical protein
MCAGRCSYRRSGAALLCQQDLQSGRIETPAILLGQTLRVRGHQGSLQSTGVSNRVAAECRAEIPAWTFYFHHRAWMSFSKLPLHSSLLPSTQTYEGTNALQNCPPTCPFLRRKISVCPIGMSLASRRPVDAFDAHHPRRM